jgi:hypothetical protein
MPGIKPGMTMKDSNCVPLPRVAHDVDCCGGEAQGTSPLVPAKAGTQRNNYSGANLSWIPAFAGMSDHGIYRASRMMRGVP